MTRKGMIKGIGLEPLPGGRGVFAIVEWHGDLQMEDALASKDPKAMVAKLDRVLSDALDQLRSCEGEPILNEYGPTRGDA